MGLQRTCGESVDKHPVHHYSNAPMQSSELSFPFRHRLVLPIYRQIMDQVNALVLAGGLKARGYFAEYTNVG